MNSKWYWLIRQKYRNLKFQIKKAAFRLNERKESSERLSSFSRIVIRTLLVQVAINLVLVAVLYVGDKLLLSAMEIFAKTQTDPLIAALSESILVDIVIGGIGVAGVILGLYCSNMTSVYSSKYTNAPATISSAFQRDVVTNRCIKQITGYIIFCVIILFGCLIGISFSYEFYDVSPADDLLKKLLIFDDYSFFRYSFDKLLDTLMYHLILNGTAYLEIVKWVDSRGTLQGIELVPICVSKGIKAKKVYRFFAKTPDRQSRIMFKVNNQSVVSFYLKDLGFKKTYFRQLLNKFSRFDTLGTTNLALDKSLEGI